MTNFSKNRLSVGDIASFKSTPVRIYGVSMSNNLLKYSVQDAKGRRYEAYGHELCLIEKAKPKF